MICTKCGKEINKDFKLCPYCGESVNKLTCPKCNKELESDYNLCPYCGENLKTHTQSKEIEEEPIHERGSGLIRFIFVMVGLILVVALIYGFASSCPSNKTPPTIIRHGKTCDIDGTIIGYYFSIKANDNYEDITIEYTFYTHSGDIFANNKLTKKDCKKGETYTLEVHLYQNQVSRIDFKNVLCQINSFS
ncbi:MAG: zinc ribbon domain-containing protein [Alphaproteobacteria bacterium]|nr:zinc ribbon domain-containing protein [Alphaproteobacteria bacterium]